MVRVLWYLDAANFYFIPSSLQLHPNADEGGTRKLDVDADRADHVDGAEAAFS